MSMGGLTGALTLPTGTDAQQPVGANGKIRYSTTGHGVQAWNGSTSSYLYFPWAEADNFGASRIPYSNSGGTALTSSTNFTFDSNNRFKAGEGNSFTGGSRGIALGQNNTVSANNAIAIGQSNTASTAAGIAIGANNSAGGSFPAYAIGSGNDMSAAGGYNIALGTGNTMGSGSSNYNFLIGRSNTFGSYNSIIPEASITMGINGRTELPRAFTFSSGRFSVNGDAQSVEVQLKETSSADSAYLKILGGVTDIHCHSSSVWMWDVQLVALCTQTGGSVTVNEVATYGRRFTIKKFGTHPTVLNIQTIGSDYEEGGMAGGGVFFRPVYGSPNQEFMVIYIRPPGADADTRIRVLAKLKGVKIANLP
jgi:hypothetical protein